MKHINKKLLFLALFSLGFKSYAFNRLHQYETSRLKSTSGTGVGSVLQDESAVLNPASSAFFNNASFYASKSDGDFTALENSPSVQSSRNIGFIAVDSNPNMSGSVHYFKTSESYLERKSYGLSFSGRLDDKSSMGVTVSKKEDTSSNSSLFKSEEYYTTDIGYLQVVNPNLSYGFLVRDAFRTRNDSQRVNFGFQYGVFDSISLLADLGSSWKDNLSDKLAYSGALQFKILNDFMLYTGLFNNKATSERGNSIGVSWIQPRMTIDFGIKNTKILKDTKTTQLSYELKETSLSVGLRF